MATFSFDPALGFASLERMRGAADGTVTLAGDAWAQGAMAALLRAEFLAAEAGVVPWFTTPDGEKSVLVIGAARERIADAPDDVRTIYLATHGIVRATHASAQPSRGGTLQGGDDLGEPTTLLIALVIVAVAAIVGAAWYFTSRSAIEVEGRNVRTTALASDAAAIAREQLQRTGKIDPGVWEVFKAIADAESGRSWLPVALVGGLVVAGGGALAWKHWQKAPKETRR